MAVCKPEYLIGDLKIINYVVPSMNKVNELKEFIRTWGYQRLKTKEGFTSLEDIDDKFLLSRAANRIHENAQKRLEKYKFHLEDALADWNLDEQDKKIILNIKEELKNNKNKTDLEEDLYRKLAHLPLNYPLMELFSLISKN